MKTFSPSVHMGPLAFLLVIAATSSAQATTSGWVKGRITFYQNQGNYCPSSRTCTGANYLQSAYQKAGAASYTKVYVVDNQDRPIGSGVTDLNGDFLINWTSTNNASSGHFYWSFEHKDNRFAIRSGTGAQWVAWTQNITLPNNTTISTATDFGTKQWGDSSSPHAVANVNDGAFRQWHYALSYSGLMDTNFKNVEVRAFNTTCSTSCASGKLVNLDTNASTPYAPAARIMHELGHIASDQASQGNEATACTAYNWANTNPATAPANSGTWGMTTAEFGCAQYEEGLATFVGDVARYWNNAPGATADTCTSVTTGVCSTLLESRAAACNTNANSPESRWPISVTRSMWDAYDNANDSESFQESYWRLLANQNNFAVGFGNNKRDEPWNSSWVYDDGDGKSLVDACALYNANYSVNLASLLTNNCNPVGD